jgi:peptide/nickel transport system substrate-binding protein
MKSLARFPIVLSLLIIASLILAACGQQAAPQPEEIIKTVVVTQVVEGETVEVVVTPTPGAEAETPTGDVEHYILADEQIPCKPLPEMAFLTTGSEIASLDGSLLKTAWTNQEAVDSSESEEGIFGPQFSPAPQSDKVYRVGVFSDVTTLNLFSASGPSNSVWNAYMLPRRLKMYDLTEKYFTFVPYLAAVPTPPAMVQEGDFWVAEIPIRQDVAWSDGEPVTAADVAFSANSVLELGLISGNWQSWYDSNFIDHVEAVDDYTVKYVYHTKPGLARHEYGVLQGPIVAEHFWAPIVAEALAPLQELADDASDEEKAAATMSAQDILFAFEPDGEPIAGAFQVEKWEPGAFLDTSANLTYFQSGLKIEQFQDGAYRDSEGLVIGEPQGDPETVIDVGPHVSSVIYTIYGSQDAAILALKNDEVDFVANPLGLQRGLAEQIRNEPNLTVLDNRVNGYRYLSFNNRRRPMNDCSFRQAVAVLIDKEFVTGTILQGVAFPFYSYVAEGNEAWYNDDIPKLGQGLNREQRLQMAIAILEQAGYTWEGDQKPAWNAEENSVVPGGQLIMPDGVPVPFMELWAPSPGYDPLRSTFAVWIETWLNEFGIPVKANLAGFNTLLTLIFTEQEFDMYILGRSLGIFPSDLRDNFSQEQSVFDGNNAGGYYNPEFEDLSFQLLTCDTFASCKDIANRLQALLALECPHVILFDTGIIEAYRSANVEYPYTEQLSGLQYTHNGGYLQADVKIK